MQIDSDQIDCFLEVARLSNFTKAAEVLYTSQSAVSRKVAALESQLNVELIRRGHRELALTSADEDFQRLLREFRTRLLEMHVKINAGRIAFGVFHGCDLTDSLGDAVEHFITNNPNVNLQIGSGNNTALLDGLKVGQFDFVIGLKEPLSGDENLIVEDICEVHRAVVFAANNPLADKIDLRFEDFRDQIYYAFTDEKSPLEWTGNKKNLCQVRIQTEDSSAEHHRCDHHGDQSRHRLHSSRRTAARDHQHSIQTSHSA